MINTLYLKTAMGLLGAAVFSGFVYLVYDKVYDSGYSEAENKYKAEIAELTRSIEKKKTEVEVLSNLLDETRTTELKEVRLTLDEYIKEFRRLNRPTTVITKEGKCVPSQEFIEAWNEILRRSKNGN